MTNEKFNSSTETSAKTSRKPFDSTVCFTFFGDWAETIKELETENDRKSSAYMLFRAIADYSMYGDAPQFESVPHLKPFWNMIRNGIDQSVERRKGGFAKEETDKRYQTVKTYLEQHPGASCRQIEEATGISKSSVDRILKKLNHKNVSDSRAIPSPVCPPASVAPISSSGKDINYSPVLPTGGDTIYSGGNFYNSVGRDSGTEVYPPLDDEDDYSNEADTITGNYDDDELPF